MTQNSGKSNWDDLKHLLAVARHGSTLAASRALAVDQSTVQRRLAELERRLGQTLVQRHATGYRLTEFGLQVLPLAQHVEAAMQAFEEGVAALKADLSGVIRMTCPEPIVLRISRSGLFDRFHARYPGLRVQFVTSDRYLDLNKGDADVALRSGDTDDAGLMGRKVGDSFWAVYASRDYIARCGRPLGVQDLAGHALLGFDETMAGHRAAKWLATVAPQTPLAGRSNSVLGLIDLVKSGMGVAPLPMPLGDVEPDLVRVIDAVPELTRIWRLLTTPALRKTPRVSAFFDFIVEEMETLQPTLTG